MRSSSDGGRGSHWQPCGSHLATTSTDTSRRKPPSSYRCVGASGRYSLRAERRSRTFNP